MKTVIVLLSIITFSTAVAAADPPRLALWVTDSFSTEADPGERCKLTTPAPVEAPLPASAPTVTEQDVVAWTADTARWTLNTARFARSDASSKLQDHCFVLAIDGKLIVRGMVLSSHSARLTNLPTIKVYDHEEALHLQLISGNRVDAQLLHAEELDAVLGQQPIIEFENPNKMIDMGGEEFALSGAGNNSNRTETICDDKGRVILRSNDTGDISEYTYHPQSGKLLFVMSNDLKTEFKYDEQGSLVHAENSNGQVIDLEYGNTPLIQHIVEVNRAEDTRREMTFKYNDAGEPTEITLIGTGKIVVEYDDKGEISKVDSDGGAKVAIQVTLAFQNLMGVVKVAGARL